MIQIECKGADLLPLERIQEFQGNLKKRSKQDIEKIIKSIEKYGFSFPFFVWENEKAHYCLDGHGRMQALKELQKRGEIIPPLPVSYIEAKDEAEAKQKLLRLNSQYGAMSIESVLEFADGIELNFEELSLPDGGALELTQNKNTERKEAEYKEKYELIIDCKSELFLEEIYNEMIERGLVCRISTL